MDLLQSVNQFGIVDLILSYIVSALKASFYIYIIFVIFFTAAFIQKFFGMNLIGATLNLLISSHIISPTGSFSCTYCFFELSPVIFVLSLIGAFGEFVIKKIIKRNLSIKEDLKIMLLISLVGNLISATLFLSSSFVYCIVVFFALSIFAGISIVLYDIGSLISLRYTAKILFDQS